MPILLGTKVAQDFAVDGNFEVRGEKGAVHWYSIKESREQWISKIFLVVFLYHASTMIHALNAAI